MLRAAVGKTAGECEPQRLRADLKGRILCPNGLAVQIDDGVTRSESGGIWKTADERMNDTAGEPLVVRIKGVASNVLVTVNESDLNQ